ncbi:glycoside hydrolase family 17 protein [Daldinia vernicosa]|uniref:glycoside hydrolase family 17 protein n=1 Tax=Daldinia vernicosa TaxID=114800 RepID=UPI002007BC64|nr:glycoside hydrolase family 17 protein [Daldinia vernicosa]KAI0851385.1 glycoside hydrolase family 17 protein [Daldinia vernicosa]
MKATIAVAAAAALTGVNAVSVHHRHARAHDAFRALEKKADNATCGCTTIYSTYYGEATLSFPPVPPTTSATATAVATPSSSSVPPPPPATTSSTAVLVPTPIPQTVSTTGVYTFPATTVTLTDSTTVVVPSTTAVPSGTHTLGGVTTIVTTETTVTCPYATVSTSEGVTTSVIETTTYVCPSAGTYTIAPITTTVDKSTIVTVPSVTNFPPGTYTQPEVVTTVTETNTVIYCPFDTPTPSVSTTPIQVPTSVPVAVPTSVVVPTTSIVPELPITSIIPTISIPQVSSISVPEVSTSVPEVPKSSSYPASTPSSSTSTPKPSGTLGGPAGQPWGISYTPYETSQQGGCKSASQVEEDIAAIAAAGIEAVRVYSTDCDTLPNVGGACEKHGLKMILGIFIDSPGCDAQNPTVSEQISAIKDWAKWELVDLISVGNEAVFHGYCEPAELASLITKCKGEFTGYTGQYTTAETVNIWQQSDFSSAICGVVDVAGANAHAFFNTQTVASQAGEFVKGQLDIVSNICDNVSGIILETGWPSAGVTMGLAVPGVAEQAVAIKSIVKECGDKAVMFSYSSDAWKDPNTACQCEPHFGVAAALGISISI